MFRATASIFLLAGFIIAGCQDNPKHPPSMSFGPGNSLHGMGPDTGMQGFRSGGITGSGNSLMSGFRPAMPDQLNNGFRGY